VFYKYKHWYQLSKKQPSSLKELKEIIYKNRSFSEMKTLFYGNHGLYEVCELLKTALDKQKKIALYADYDVDGTMSCVSWIWFLESINYKNYLYYIPCRLKEGYGVHLNSIKHLIHDQKAEIIITMDTGITANIEAAYCRKHGVEFICTDHHVIQADKMPDSVILNPKIHPDKIYQELCGAGITFVLLRQLAKNYPVPNNLWQDLLAITAMATICDVVPLNSVNHHLAKIGIDALFKSQRPILKNLREAAHLQTQMSEEDIGFRLGPRINAVGRLEHAEIVIKAFISGKPAKLIEHMTECNDRRKQIQQDIFKQADQLAQNEVQNPILFLGGNWHRGVLGIAASKIAEKYWRPTWLFNREASTFYGSARSIPNFDVTAAMESCKEHFVKYGGHQAAGGFHFLSSSEKVLKKALINYAKAELSKNQKIWDTQVSYDCILSGSMINFDLVRLLESLKPFGRGFEEPTFLLSAQYIDKHIYKDQHTACFLLDNDANKYKVMFFNHILPLAPDNQKLEVLLKVRQSSYRNRPQVNIIGVDYRDPNRP